MIAGVDNLMLLLCLLYVMQASSDVVVDSRDDSDSYLVSAQIYEYTGLKNYTNAHSIPLHCKSTTVNAIKYLIPRLE